MRAKGLRCSRRLRLTSANARTVGATDGSIIATIMSAHIANRRNASQAVQACMLGMSAAINGDPCSIPQAM